MFLGYVVFVQEKQGKSSLARKKVRLALVINQTREPLHLRQYMDDDSLLGSREFLAWLGTFRFLVGPPDHFLTLLDTPRVLTHA